MTTANKGLEQPAYNSNVNTWGIGPLNDNFGYIDLALGGSTLLNATGLGGTTVILTASQCRPLTLAISGAPGGIVTYSVPAGIGGQWVVRNGTSGGYALRILSAAGGGTVTINAGDNVQVSCDGTATGMVRNDTTASASGANTQVQYNSAGVLAGSANMTFNGTTLTVAGLNNTGATVLGDAAGDTFTINSSAASIPNTFNVGSDTLYLTSATKQVGIGTAAVGANKLTVAGTVASTTGGFVFPDTTTQTTAATATTVFQQVFTSNGTYTPHAGMVTCIIECIGGGGAGGGSNGTGSQVNVGGGGGSGGYSRKLATAAAIGASKAVTIGAGGTAGAAGPNAGGNGGDTSVGTLCIAKGGTGGGGTDVNVTVGSAGAGGVAGTGDVTAAGASGMSGYAANTAAVSVFGAAGGSSIFGGGAAPAAFFGTGDANGAAASAYGSGGGGGYTSNSIANVAGGAGSSGIVVITEYCN